MLARFKSGDTAGAVEVAALAAPYMHAKLSSTDLHVQGSLSDKSDDDLAAELADLDAKLLVPQQAEKLN
jgi:hypothetical protein